MKMLVLLLAASPAFAGNFFVAKRGDDRNDGLARTTAFATVQRGVSALQPGDTLSIGPGEYAENITHDDLGSMEADTIIRAEKPGTVLLRGDVPAPEFRPLAGHRFVYEADFRFDGPIPCVNELDTLSILRRMPNITEVEFIPGTFFHDAKAGKLYVSSSDLKPPPTHRYSVSVEPDNGLYLLHPKRVIIEGLTFTGFNAMTLVHYSKGTAGSVWGAFLMSAKQCVIRDCSAYLNGFGIALNSQEPGSGDNVIERCKAWGNSSQFANGDMGGITAYGARRDVIRDCVAWRNGVYGINIYGTGGAPPNGNDGGNTPENKSRIVGCIAWGNESADLKVKTGYDYFHTVENCICAGLLHANNVTQTTFGKWTSADKNTDPSNAELSEKKADEMKKLQQVMSSSPSAVRAPASLHLVSPLVVRSVSATTANIEWTTSLPAVCRIAWGDTPACEQSATLDVHHWGSYSLTSLKPGQRYYFAVTELSVPKDFAEKMDAKHVKLGAEVINFTTKTQDAAPQTFYVATDGDDTRSGRSRTEAWRSIRHAADNVNVGDMVLIAGGKYSERVRMRATGTKSAPITFKAMPGERVDLDGMEQALNGAFVSSGKAHLRFDGFYFANFNLFPNRGWLPVQGADFQLAHGSDITISRCFSDGRGGYSAVPVIAAFVNRLTIENCVNTYKFGGGFYIWRCPDLLVRNCVFAEPMIQAFILRNEKNQPSMMEKCIFTDMLDKKARLNIALLCCDGEIDAFRNRDCCYFLRDCIPLRERAMNGSATLDKLTPYILDPLFADPQFAGDPGAKGNASDKSGFSPDRLMDSALKLDFQSFFATNPELIRRGIGLQREAFSDFHFTQPAKR